MNEDAGIGKSKALKKLAKKAGLKLKTLKACFRDAADFGVVPTAAQVNCLRPVCLECSQQPATQPKAYENPYDKLFCSKTCAMWWAVKYANIFWRWDIDKATWIENTTANPASVARIKKAMAAAKGG